MDDKFEQGPPIDGNPPNLFPLTVMVSFAIVVLVSYFAGA
jgi:hypothetical protein